MEGWRGAAAVGRESADQDWGLLMEKIPGERSSDTDPVESLTAFSRGQTELFSKCDKNQVSQDYIGKLLRTYQSGSLRTNFSQVSWDPYPQVAKSLYPPVPQDLNPLISEDPYPQVSQNLYQQASKDL